MIDGKHLELLQFHKITDLVRERCFSKQARALCDLILPQTDREKILAELERTAALKHILASGGYFPGVEHEDVQHELRLLAMEGSMLHEAALYKVARTTEATNTMIRFLKTKRSSYAVLAALADDLETNEFVVTEIDRIIDPEATVKNTASPELARIRRQVIEKRRESDKRFYHYVAEMRKQGYLRENEEGFYNGRRTLAVLVEYKSEVPGFVHGKSETGKTIFIEPGATIAINNDIAELEIDEHREINRILRELCAQLQPFATSLQLAVQLLILIDFIKAKAVLAVELGAVLPDIGPAFDLSVNEAYHPLLYLQNKKARKLTIPLSLKLNSDKRIIVISGPNAGGKTIALKTIGLLQVMLQSGLLIPVKENSTYCFFEKVLVDIGDTQSIENELSTYSAKLKTMTSVLDQINDSTLVLMDEFGSGTDPELGGAIAEAVLESLVSSKTRGIITSHFGNVKLLAEKLDGAVNASMLFDIDTLEPKYILSVGEPGSSYTFEVAERIGFPKHLIERAKLKVDKDKLKLSKLLADVQGQKAKLAEQMQRSEHEEFLRKIAKEKYHTLFNNWEEKINKERERKIELARLAEYGQKYLRLMADWNEKKDKKDVIKRFIDGITAESKKQELLRRQKKLDVHAEKKIARIKTVLKVGSKVKILNGKEIGVVEDIRDEKVYVKFGIMKMTVGMQNLVLAEE